MFFLSPTSHFSACPSHTGTKRARWRLLSFGTHIANIWCLWHWSISKCTRTSVRFTYKPPRNSESYVQNARRGKENCRGRSPLLEQNFRFSNLRAFYGTIRTTLSSSSCRSSSIRAFLPEKALLCGRRSIYCLQQARLLLLWAILQASSSAHGAAFITSEGLDKMESSSREGIYQEWHGNSRANPDYEQDYARAPWPDHWPSFAALTSKPLASRLYNLHHGDALCK